MKGHNTLPVVASSNIEQSMIHKEIMIKVLILKNNNKDWGQNVVILLHILDKRKILHTHTWTCNSQANVPYISISKHVNNVHIKCSHKSSLYRYKDSIMICICISPVHVRDMSCYHVKWYQVKWYHLANSGLKINQFYGVIYKNI